MHTVVPEADQAELVAFRISHRAPAIAVLHKIWVWPPPSSSKRLDARGGELDIVHGDIQVNAVLDQLGLWHPLE